MIELMKQVACELDKELIYDDESKHYARMPINDVIDVTFYHDYYRKKFNIGLSYARSTGLGYTTFYGAPFYSIGISDSRDFKSVARDINRRVILSAEAARYEVDVRKNIEKKLYQQQREENIHNEILTVEKSIGSFYSKKRNITIDRQTGRVEISSNRLTTDALIKIINLIDEDAR